MDRSKATKTDFVFTNGGVALWERTGAESHNRAGRPQPDDTVTEEDLAILKSLPESLDKEKLIDCGFVAPAGMNQRSCLPRLEIDLVYTEYFIKVFSLLDQGLYARLGSPKAGDYVLKSEIMLHTKALPLDYYISEGSLTAADAKFVHEALPTNFSLKEWAESSKEEPQKPMWPSVDPHFFMYAADELPVAPLLPPSQINTNGTRSLKRYQHKDVVQDMEGNGILGTVFVECGARYNANQWPLRGPFDPIAESAWVQSIAEESPVPMGIVAHVDLVAGPEMVEKVIIAHKAAARNLVGIRHNLAWHPFLPMVSRKSVGQPPELSKAPSFRNSVREIGKQGLIFETWIYHVNIGEIISLAKDCPETQIVIDRLCGPIGSDRVGATIEKGMEEWKLGTSELAKYANVSIKLCGLSAPITGLGFDRQEKPPSSKEMAKAFMPWIEHCINEFGVSRCMFASNFPQDKASSGYTTLWNAYKLVAAECLEGDELSQRALFYDNAVRIYGLDKAPFGLPASSTEAEDDPKLQKY